MRVIVKSFLVATAMLSINLFVSTLFVKSANASVDLSITQVDPKLTFAIPDDNFTNGWKWTFDVTVPYNETILRMNFIDLVSTSSNPWGIIPVTDNLRLFSDHSTNASTSDSAIIINGSAIFSGPIYLDSTKDIDNDASNGRQIQISVEAKIPVGSPNGVYNLRYGIRSSDATDSTHSPSVILHGPNPMTVQKCGVYIEWGAIIYDNGINVSDSIVPVISPSVLDTSIIGTTTIIYTATDATGNVGSTTRTVSVEGIGECGSEPDTTAPVITLDGADPINLLVGDTYTELGATALDNIDGSFAATPTGSVNIGVVGSYTITYNATDVAGNPATPITRTVNVNSVAVIGTHTINVWPPTNGSISPNGVVVVNDGDSQIFTITANDGYHILDVMINGFNSVGAVSTYTFTNVTTDHNIKAFFDQDQD